MPAVSVAFYVVAHQDDWALFCGEQAHADLLAAGTRVVFVYTTAGDAGQTDGWWEAREQGALAAVRAALPARPITTRVVRINGHPIVQHRCAGSVSYCLRLPDGSPGGGGYPSTGHSSLSKLRDSDAPITAVDGSTTYTTWRDLCDTLAALLARERGGIDEGDPWINALDYCAAVNPADHADHAATAGAVRSLAAGAYHRAWWSTYCIERLPANLSGEALARKRATFFAYAGEVQRVTALAGAAVAPDENEWRAWGDRSYPRRVPRDEPDVDAPTLPFRRPEGA